MTHFLADISSNIAGQAGHVVHTVARLNADAPGHLIAVSRFRSVNWLSGFKAAAVVLLVDENERVIAASHSQHGWADGTWIGRSDNYVNWSYQFDPVLAAQAKNIAVLHSTDENYLGNIMDFIRRNEDTIKFVMRAVAMSGGGGMGAAVG